MRFIADERERVGMHTLRDARLGAAREQLRGASVLVLLETQLAVTLALLELDGLARRIVLCPPDLDPQHLTFVQSASEADAVLSQHPPPAKLAGLRPVSLGPPAEAGRTDATLATEWILFTSGTTGRPKMAVHTLRSLTGAITEATGPKVVWSTFYDIRRYGGLQILLRALVGGGSMVLSAPDEPPAKFIARAIEAGVTHISGTPSHWRRAILAGALAGFSPRYVRLSGETADQAVLGKLQELFPGAGLGHAFASTEAGVAFEVQDGLAGIPAALFGAPTGAQEAGRVELRIEEGTLRIRSPRTANRYLGEDAPPLQDEGGFVDTKDLLELRGDRYHFAGRSDAVINVGGLKVYPEEVEAVLNRHPLVQLSLVKGRRSPLVGSVVVADIVLQAHCSAEPNAAELAILDSCRDVLPWWKVPAALRFVPALTVTPAGKLARGIA